MGAARRTNRRSRPWVAPTIRLRLTLLYGTVFLVTGAVLLTIGYLLVRNNLSHHHQLREILARLGRKPAADDHLITKALGVAPGSTEAKVAHAVANQITASALHTLLVEYLVALLAVTMASVATGYLLAGRALRPLRAITATARRVSSQNLGERIALEGPADELLELADTFDRMLERLDAAFASQRHFVANASHELRTPLAIMRTEVDVTLSDADASIDELRAMGEAVRETVDRCERLIGGLLMLARSEAATGRGEPVDVAALAGDCITDLRARAEEAHVEVRDELEPAWTLGEPALIERLVANLIDNGIHHNEPGGFLDVSTRVRAGRVQLRVRNGGSPIDPSDARQLVEPFRRLDRSVDGFGLGLSIVRSVVEAHRGMVTVQARAEGGLDVTVDLPALAAAPLPAQPRAQAALAKS
ncbi:MAG TPA: HAMP domain-containing sensor histidine kinase [Solirubrobacteraceae bacterium]|nr:HAMP domain-containing sensor histidine kinase [Solirubrobacteraceae bacterium]